MNLVTLDITDFRNITKLSFEPCASGVTLITGPNGAGKTSVLEAITFLATLRSLRGAPRQALVKHGSDRAVLRGETLVGERALSIEGEIPVGGQARMFVNRQRVERRSALHEALQVTAFTPESIEVVRGSPAERRAFLDRTLEVVDPRIERHIEEVERILRQRAALLRSCRGRHLAPEIETTLDVWDARLGADGTRLADARDHVATELAPLTEAHYARLAGRSAGVGLEYRRSWSGRLVEALGESRRSDIERGATSVGPHRDELVLTLGGLPARSHASQGEQRTLALSLVLAAHALAAGRLGSPPVLLLDDVFSELDPQRAKSLLGEVPTGQTVITAAGSVPAGSDRHRRYAMEGGRHVPSPSDPGRRKSPEGPASREAASDEERPVGRGAPRRPEGDE